MNNPHRPMFAACIFTLMMVSASCADTIAMKSSVRLPAGVQIVKLSNIAELEGTDALSFADLEIADVALSGSVLEIPIRDVRTKLEDAGANWARINLSGRMVVVRNAGTTASGADANPPLAMMPVSIESADEQPRSNRDRHEQLAANDLVTQPTLRGTIANLVVSSLHTEPANLRLTFDRSDTLLLDTPVENTRFEVQPLGSMSSDRIDLAVRIWVENKVQQGRTISVNPSMRKAAATLRRDIRKDEVITANDLETTEQWLSPSLLAMTVDEVAATGRAAAKNLKAGELIRTQHLRRDTMIKRGDRAMVRCIVGGVAISLQAEARADAAEGEMIEFRKHGERDTFLATVTGPGEAIVDLSKK